MSQADELGKQVAVIFNSMVDETKRPRCYDLAISPELKCTPEMIALCEQEDGVLCDGHGKAKETK